MKEKVAEIINVLFGFRKFIVMLIAILIAVVFRLKGYISGDNMVDLLKATVIAFFGSNSVEHIMSVVKDAAAARAGAAAAAVANVEQVVPPDEIEPDDEEAQDAKTEAANASKT